jgi:cytochrome P450
MDISTMLDPALWFQQMRQESPVFYQQEVEFYFGTRPAWQIFRYQDVQEGLSNFELFSNEYIPKQPGSLGNSLPMTDPPDHKKLRSLMNKAFAPAIINPLEYWIAEKCQELLQPSLLEGKIDFIRDFADILPSVVIARLLGIPEEDHHTITHWTRTLISNPLVVGLEAYQKVQMEMGAYFWKTLEDRRRTPQEDLLTFLLSVSIDDEKLSTEDVISNCIAILAAGSESVSGLLGNAMLTFAERPALQEHLVQHTVDVPLAINEVLRFRCPALSLARIARQDLHLRGNLIRKGELINLWIASANRDPDIFPDPDTFIMRRDHSKTLSFGYGIHHCIGFMLAKLETKIAFDYIFRHFRNIGVDRENVLSRVSNISSFKYQTLKITFSTN